MLPTLEIGDNLMAVMAPARAEALPARGDLVLYTPGPGQPIYIHRLIALPGERFQMRGGIPHIDGVALPREPVGSPGDHHFVETLPGGRRIEVMETLPSSPFDNTTEMTVPPGHVFVLGDNRDNAMDSRGTGPGREPAWRRAAHPLVGRLRAHRHPAALKIMSTDRPLGRSEAANAARR